MNRAQILDRPATAPARAAALRARRLRLGAAGIAALTAVVHLFVGTPEIQAPLLQSALPQEVRLMLLLCWHLVSVALALSALALAWAAAPLRQPVAGPLVAFVGGLWLLFALVAVVLALALVGPPGLLVLPQWILLAPVGVLALLGAR